jgi:hypothetical protein
MKNLGDEKDLFNSVNGLMFGDAIKPNSRWWDGTSSGLEIKYHGSNVIEIEDAVDEKIPDNNEAGIIRSMTLAAPGLVKSVEIAIDVTHTYIGDLTVTLVSQKGTSVVLHNHFGAGQDNLRKTYSASSTPDLKSSQESP